MPFLNPSTATATVAQNTNVITLTGVDLTVVSSGMTISLGDREAVVGPQYLLSGVSPNGTSGGTVTTLKPVPTAYTNAPFIIDTTGFLGTDATYVATTQLALLSALLTLLGPNTHLYSGSRQLAVDKSASTALSRLIYSTGGRAWADLAHRTLTYTPTGGAQTSVDTLSLRAFLDGTTATDALLVDLTTGGVDVLAATSTMVAASMVDLGSAPTTNVNITGAATINSLGPGKNKVREICFYNDGAILVHSASLILPTSKNITVRAGDTMRVTSDSTGTWRVRSFNRADGTPLPFDGDWVSYTPVITPASGSFGAAPSVVGAYKLIGKTLCIRIIVTFNAAGSAAAPFQVSPPVPVKAQQILPGTENAVDGSTVTLEFGSVVRLKDGTGAPLSAGRRYIFTGTLEAL